MSKLENSSSIWMDVKKFFLGGIAAGVGKTSAAPIERIRIILQTQSDSVLKQQAKY